MKMPVSIIAFLLVLALALRTGLSFSIYQNADVDENEESPLSLKRRFWGDDIQPCIVKYCIKYVHTEYYWKCLGKFCPGGLLVIPRQLDEYRRHLEDEPDELQKFDLHSLVCSPCPSGQCDLTATKTGKSVASKLDVLQQIDFGICLRRYCHAYSVDSMSFLSCAENSCCGMFPRHVATTITTSLATVKRRINDDLSQCIQSYCNGKHFRDRLLCIMKFCNRIKRY